MTDRRTKKMFKELRKARLYDAERAGALAKLTAHMADNPASEEALVKRMYHGGKVFKPEFPRVSFGFRFAPALVSITILISIGGGVSYAAEGSVPGEALYPVKLHINENIRTAFAQAPQERIEWEAERVGRRMKEAEMLASRGELTIELSEMLADKVTKHTEKLVQKMEQIGESEDAFTLAEIGADAAIELEGHDEVLMGITADKLAVSSGSEEGEITDETSRIVDAVRETSEELNKVRDAVDEGVEEVLKEGGETDSFEVVQAPSGMIELAERRRIRAEEEIAATRAYITENKDNVPSLVAETAGRMIRKAEATLHRGEESIAAGFISAALESFYEAQRTAKRTMVFVESNIVYEIEIPEEEPLVEEEPPAEEEQPAEEETLEEEPLVDETPEEEPPIVEDEPLDEVVT